MSMSSIYTETKYGPEAGLSSVISHCIERWNTAGSFVKPNGMTKNSYSPCGVMKAVFSREAGLIRICQ